MQVSYIRCTRAWTRFREQVPLRISPKPSVFICALLKTPTVGKETLLVLTVTPPDKGVTSSLSGPPWVVHDGWVILQRKFEALLL